MLFQYNKLSAGEDLAINLAIMKLVSFLLLEQLMLKLKVQTLRMLVREIIFGKVILKEFMSQLIKRLD